MRPTPVSDHASPLSPAAQDEPRPATLHGLTVGDTPSEAVFDEIAALAADICGTSMAVVSLAEAGHEWLGGRHGVPLDRMPGHAAFCAHAVTGGGFVQVPDAALDPRFAGDPLVTGEAALRFHAGAPLIADSGERHGAICVFDTRPRWLDTDRQQALLRLARHAARQFEARRERLWTQARDIAFANLIQALPDGVAICGPDGRLHLLNQAARDCLGTAIDGQPPEAWPRLLHVVDGQAGNELPLDEYPLARAMRGEPVRRHSLRVAQRDRRPRTLICSAEPLHSASGAPAGAVVVMHDATEADAAVTRLAESEARLRTALQSISDGVFTTDTEGRVAFMNRQAARLAWCPDWAAQGEPLTALLRLVDEAGALLADPLADVLAGGNERGFADACLLQPDERRIAVEYRAAPIRDAGGRLLGAMLVVRDVSETRQLSRAMEYQTTHDALTGLPNRRGLEIELGRLLRDTRATGAIHSLLFADLDQFKVVNDTCGHAAGDALLRQVVEVMRGALRSNDVLARFGGDEFAVLLPDYPLDHAVQVAERMRADLDAARFVWEDRPFGMSISLGVVAVDASASGADLVALAGSACYLAKEKGRNRIHVHRPGDLDLAQRRDELGWIPRIQRAIEDGRLILYGQRIAPLHADGRDGHIEVLLRMCDEAGALVPPMAFIPAAERYGLMQAIDRYVIERAMAALAACCRDGHRPTLAINLSGRSLGDDAFPDHVEAAFERHALPFAQVGFEITETSAIANLAQARRFIERFRARGCRFSLDDFGSGMSSFGYLKDLGVDRIKIDGTFVRNLLEDPVNEAMVAAIRNVAHVMGLKTIAEFVEDEATMARLRQIGVDYAQGFGVHRPQPLEELLRG